MAFFSKAPTIVLVHEGYTTVGFDKSCDVVLNPHHRRIYFEKYKREPPPKVLSLSVRGGDATNRVFCTLHDRNMVVLLAGYRVFRQNVPIGFPNNEVFTCGEGFYTEYFRACFSSPVPLSTPQMNTLFPFTREDNVSTTYTSSSSSTTAPLCAASDDEPLEALPVCSQFPTLMTTAKSAADDSASSAVFETKSSQTTPRLNFSSVHTNATSTRVARLPRNQQTHYRSVDTYAKSALRISPYVLERRGSLPFLRPLVLIPSPSCDCTPTMSVSLSVASSTFAAAYITANGQEVLQQQVNGEEAVPYALAAAKKTVEKMQAKFNPNANEFASFPTEEKMQLFSFFKSVATLLLQKLQCTPIVLHLRSPLMCCGDIHGSFRDLHTILEQSAPFGHWSLLYSPILFLGDFVDRGPHSVEVILVLFSWALLCPNKIHLVRGNHEDPSVNGNSDLYGDRSFIARAKAFFGDANGLHFWQLTNLVFSFLPVAAVVDDTIFACHGGIPLLARASPPDAAPCDDSNNVAGAVADSKVETTTKVSIPTEALFEALLTEENGCPYRFETVLRSDTDGELTAMRRRLIRELMWNDPAKHEEVKSYRAYPGLSAQPSASTNNSTFPQFDTCGFRCNRGRNDASGDVREFNESALAYFLERFGFSLLLRAHQQKDTGVEVVRRRRIITLFSCCDYAYGCKNCAGACLICGGYIRLISWYPEEENTSSSKFSERLFGNGSNPPSLNANELARLDERQFPGFLSSGGNSSTREIRDAEERFRRRPVAEVNEYG